MAPRHCEQPPAQKKRMPLNTRESDLIKSGEIIVDVHKKKWKLGKSIGLGAFGDIYLVTEDGAKQVGESKYVAKVEPHSNGPLFVEMNFYLRAAKLESIEKWKADNWMKHLGMPHILSFGSCVYKGAHMRFIIMPRYGDSIEKMFIKHSNKFHIKTAMTIAMHTIDILEYVHHQGYIHSDIKGLNIVLGEGPNQAPLYLVDYGLATKYKDKNGCHNDGSPDGRKADAGTLEFSSRDAHVGVISRRSDLESLGFNLITWLGGCLPWINHLSNSDLVFNLKNKAMADIPKFLCDAFSKKAPTVLFNFLMYVSNLRFDTKPDYKHCKALFSNAIIEAGFLDDGKITFDSHAKLNKKARKRVMERENLIPPKKMALSFLSPPPSRKPCSIHNTKYSRNVDNSEELDKFNWALILASNPEKIVKMKLKQQTKLVSRYSPPCKKSVSLPYNNVLLNPTPAMLKVMENRRKKSSDSPVKKFKSDSMELDGNRMTPAMEEVISKKLKTKRVLRPRALRSSKVTRLRCRL
ncbi:serine/threonine-protein kinase VRK1-like isoform X2 [Cimex lectularius]|uniref:non-specific serine/threonine protein kinase n=1 Tax=Cimex lectularius TaxID=79782 RepID=A0A8I6S6J6_CIMLE|nr:serine/threonine-protein kinase VRK1-like isoform X2 [Cimex lectularius]